MQTDWLPLTSILVHMHLQLIEPVSNTRILETIFKRLTALHRRENTEDSQISQVRLTSAHKFRLLRLERTRPLVTSVKQMLAWIIAESMSLR